MSAASPTRSGVLVVTPTLEYPLPYVLDAWRATGETVRELTFDFDRGDDVQARSIRLGGEVDGREDPIHVFWFSPKVLVGMVRAPERLVIVREINLLAMYAIVSRLLRPGRRVLTFVESDFGLAGRTGTLWWKVWFRRLLAPFISVFIANSPAAHRYLREVLRVPERRIVEGWWLAGLPTDLPAHDPPPDLPRTGEYTIASVGRLIRLKGHDLLLRAVARASQGRPDPLCSVWIVGDGPQRDALEALTRELGLEASVRFLAPMDHEHLKGVLEAADVFAFPSTIDYVGRVAVEAMSTGTPLLASSLTGAGQMLVTDGVDGLVADPDDTDAMAAALVRLADPETRSRLTAGARATAARVTPAAAAGVLAAAVARARRGRRS